MQRLLYLKVKPDLVSPRRARGSWSVRVRACVGKVLVSFLHDFASPLCILLFVLRQELKKLLSHLFSLFLRQLGRQRRISPIVPNVFHPFSSLQMSVSKLEPDACKAFMPFTAGCAFGYIPSRSLFGNRKLPILLQRCREHSKGMSILLAH